MLEQLRWWWRSFRQFCRWIPLIWRDCDWDESFLFAILERKLANMEGYFRHHGIAVNHLKDARRMRVGRLLLKRLMDEPYDEMAFAEHDRKWGELEWTLTRALNHPVHLRQSFNRANVRTAEDEAKERAGWRRCHDHAEYLHRQDLDYLFGLLAKYAPYWWD